MGSSAWAAVAELVERLEGEGAERLEGSAVLIDAAARVAARRAVTGNCYTLDENLNDDLDLKRIIVHVIY